MATITAKVDGLPIICRHPTIYLYMNRNKRIAMWVDGNGNVVMVHRFADCDSVTLDMSIPITLISYPKCHELKALITEFYYICYYHEMDEN